MKAYQIVSTFDREFDYDLPQASRAARKPKGFAAGNLPVGLNIPMAARDTLLAQNLRTGRGLSFSTQSGVDVLPRKQAFRAVTPEPMDAFALAQRSAALRGKLIGVEIEYYPTGPAPIARGLTTTAYDGSLGNSGKEVKRLTWASADGRLQGIVKLDLRGEINSKCGLHVHIDVRHLDAEAQRETYSRLIGFYPFLKKLVPKSRLRNKYCRWTDNSHGYQERYSAINWQSVGKFGTMEFRCQGGSLNPVKIETWALLCQYLVAFSSNSNNTVPRTWQQFVAILPEPLRSWCILRREKIAGNAPLLNARTLSGIDMIYNATSTARA